MYRIGVPVPVSGITRITPEGLVRDVRMGKGIHFTQHSTQWETNRYVRWTYRFSDDSFPPGALVLLCHKTELCAYTVELSITAGDGNDEFN